MKREDRDAMLVKFRKAVGLLDRRSAHAPGCGGIPCGCGVSEARQTVSVLSSVVDFTEWTNAERERAVAAERDGCVADVEAAMCGPLNGHEANCGCVECAACVRALEVVAATLRARGASTSTEGNPSPAAPSISRFATLFEAALPRATREYRRYAGFENESAPVGAYREKDSENRPLLSVERAMTPDAPYHAQVTCMSDRGRVLISSGTAEATPEAALRAYAAAKDGRDR